MLGGYKIMATALGQEGFTFLCLVVVLRRTTIGLACAQAMAYLSLIPVISGNDLGPGFSSHEALA